VKILYTESSNGWGGQEIRVLKEAIGLRARGHTCVFAVQKEGKLSSQARKEGFSVYELSFEKKYAISVLWSLRKSSEKTTFKLLAPTPP
jgi:ketol-acid reductoisomerase